MEDYKEKYEQTLERAKKFYNRELYAECNGSLVEYIFPELKESNDEKIRKNLIKFFRDLDALEYKEEDIIAWLEKQGEQKPADNVDVLMSLDEAIEHCKEKSCGNNACALEHKQLEKWLTELKELKEQKQVWSKEDENGLGDALWAIKQARTIAKDENAMGNLWYAEKWLKSLKERMKRG